MRTRTLLSAALAAAAGVAAIRVARSRRALDFSGRVVLITGGSRGLGLELARRFAAEGAKLALLARDHAELERAAQSLPDGTEVELLTCDLRVEDQVEDAISATIRRFGRLDVLVNNAGTIRVGPLATMGLNEFRAEMDINFFGAVHTVKSSLPHLQRSGNGRIVNVTSIGGRIPVPHLLPYTASKFALVGFSEALAAELAGTGVRVTTVTPGLMRTGSPYRAMFGGRRDREFRWFLLADSLPVVSVSSGKAARRIVEACRFGDASVMFPGYVRVPIALHAVAPGLAAGVAGALARLLPKPAAGLLGGQMREGREVLSPEESPAYAALTKRAARRNNQLG